MSLPVIAQPWTEVIVPPAGSEAPVTAKLVRAMPAVAKAIGVYTGLVKQMPMEAVRGVDVLPTPRLLTQPDPIQSTANFLDCAVSDYLLHGNAIAYTTALTAEGRPAAVQWLPASRVALVIDPRSSWIQYWFDGIELDPAHVAHVRRGADPMQPQRGVGVVEQHVKPFRRFSAQDEYELRTLDGAAVPSVAVIAPNADLRQEEADAAKEDWVAKYGGAVRKPAVLPAGTQVIPLSWSPHDSEMTEARKLSLLDIANIFGMDGYWLGAPTSSMTYRSPGPMFLTLLRQTINPVVVDFEQVWGQSWLPYGTNLRFQRRAVLQDDMGTMVTYGTQAVAGGLWTVNEAREWMGMARSDDPAADELKTPQTTPTPPPAAPEIDPTQEGIQR